MGLLAPIFWLAAAPGPGGSQGNLIVPPASKDAESILISQFVKRYAFGGEGALNVIWRNPDMTGFP